MRKRVRLTAAEIDAVIAVAGNALPWETFVDGGDDESEAMRRVEDYERGVGKLLRMAAALRSRVRRPPRGGR